MELVEDKAAEAEETPSSSGSNEGAFNEETGEINWDCPVSRCSAQGLFSISTHIAHSMISRHFAHSGPLSTSSHYVFPLFLSIETLGVISGPIPSPESC